MDSESKVEARRIFSKITKNHIDYLIRLQVPEINDDYPDDLPQELEYKPNRSYRTPKGPHNTITEIIKKEADAFIGAQEDTRCPRRSRFSGSYDLEKLEKKVLTQKLPQTEKRARKSRSSISIEKSPVTSVPRSSKPPIKMIIKSHSPVFLDTSSSSSSSDSPSSINTSSSDSPQSSYQEKILNPQTSHTPTVLKKTVNIAGTSFQGLTLTPVAVLPPGSIKPKPMAPIRSVPINSDPIRLNPVKRPHGSRNVPPKSTVQPVEEKSQASSSSAVVPSLNNSDRFMAVFEKYKIPPIINPLFRCLASRFSNFPISD
jgi:hypothetical protein